MRGRIGEIDVPVSWVHGDFKTDNIMTSVDRAVGIDTGANFENVILLDLSHFLNQLELSLFDPRSIRMLSKRQTLVDRFKGGYGGFTESEEMCLTWFRLLAAIRLWAEHQCQEKSILHRYDNLRYRYLVRSLIRDLQR